MITVIFGGPSSPEHGISILTGLQCERALSSKGHQVQSIYWSRAGGFHLLPVGLEAKDFENGVPREADELSLQLGEAAGFYRRSGLRRKALDVGTVLNCCHGGPGEGGVLGSLLELAGIPSTGGSAWSAMLGMDKLAFAAVARYLDIPTLPRLAVTPGLTDPGFPPPYIVKPRLGGSSLGIQVAADLETAKELAGAYPPLRSGAVLEPYRADAADLNLAFRTDPEPAFSLLEKPLRDPSNEFYDYAAKYLRGGGLQAAPRELPAKVAPQVEEQAKAYATRLIQDGGFTGVGRIDFLLAPDDTLYVNEINTIPGAMAFYLWPGEVQYDDLLLGMVREAARKPGWPVGGSDDEIGAALRVASGISEKLMQRRGN